MKNWTKQIQVETVILVVVCGIVAVAFVVWIASLF